MRSIVRSLATFAILTSPVLAQLVTAVTPLANSGESPLPLPKFGDVAPLSERLGGIFNGLTISVPTAETIVYKQGAESLGVDFDAIDLPTGCSIEITSLLDQDSQILTSKDVDAGRIVSAYFNGPALRVRVIAAPGTKPSVRLAAMSITMPLIADPMSICGTADNRWLSSHRPMCRLIIRKGTSNYICTGWLVSTSRGGHVTAGHCLSGASAVTSQYNVPTSTSSGGRRNPPSADQYSWISTTRRYSNGGVGNDWGVYRVNGNPYLRQGAYFRLAAPSSGRYVYRGGYGSASGTRNFAQKTHGGSITSVIGNTVYYRIDSTGGDSGGPVWYSSYYAVGIHTHGGCTATGGSNKATNVLHSSFLSAYYGVR
ncbi:MAG: trypsin-like serine protease [Planctomycetes bacterium]|nr:trypsin-like serine protease [Planctomycetota bacterium]